MKNNVIVLFSGGIDSTACLHYYLKEKFNVTPLFIDYGQSANKKEFNSAKKIANYFKLTLHSVKIEMETKFGTGEIKGRNAFFVMTVLMKYSEFAGLISLGIHFGTPYYDCSKQFIDDMKRVLNNYSDGKIQIDAPFLNWEKVTIYEYCRKNDIPIELTYSCELGSEPPCGQCLSCLDRKLLNVC